MKAPSSGHQKLLTHLENISDDSIEALSGTLVDGENVFHAAARSNHCDIMKCLLTSLRKDEEALMRCLRLRRELSRAARFWRKSSLTPLEIAVQQWRDDGDRGMFDAIMDKQQLSVERRKELLQVDGGRSIVDLAHRKDIICYIQDLQEELQEKLKVPVRAAGALSSL